MCGTLKRSRTIVTPRRGTRSPSRGPSGVDAEALGLERTFVRSAAVTWSNSGVSASYIFACSSAPGGDGHAAVLAGGDDVERGAGVVLGRGAAASASVRTDPSTAPATVMERDRGRRPSPTSRQDRAASCTPAYGSTARRPPREPAPGTVRAVLAPAVGRRLVRSAVAPRASRARSARGSVRFLPST